MSAPIVELVAGPNNWVRAPYDRDRRCASCYRAHCCYFCGPECFPPMPENHTLCARCAQLIFTPGFNDPMNDAMIVCPACEEDLMLDEM